MKPAIRWAFSRLENHTWRSVINETPFKWKSAPSRILCCGLVPLISVCSVLGARTNCAHYIHKEHEPGKAAGTLECGTGNQTGEMIGKNVIHQGEKVKGTYCIYRGKISCRNAEWREKYLILKKIIEKLWWVQPVLKPSTKGCCEKEKCITEIIFFNERNLEGRFMCPSSLLIMGKLWALLSKKDVEQRRESWAKWPEQPTGKLEGQGLCTVYKREHNSLQTHKKVLQRGKKLIF